MENIIKYTYLLSHLVLATFLPLKIGKVIKDCAFKLSYINNMSESNRQYREMGHALTLRFND